MEDICDYWKENIVLYFLVGSFILTAFILFNYISFLFVTRDVEKRSVSAPNYAL